MGVFDLMVIVLGLISMGIIIYNMRVTGRVSTSIRAVIRQQGEEAVVFEGQPLRPIVYVADEVVRDDTGTLGERLSNLARSVRLNVTYTTSLFMVDRSRLLARIEDEIKRAEFAYQATRHVRYQERIRFLRNLYNEVVRVHTPYTYRYGVIVWVPPGDPGAEARAEAFRSMVEAEAGVRLERARGGVMEALVPGSESPIVTGESYAGLLANIGEEPGVVVGRDPEGRLVVLDWPRDFETHMGVFGPTGRGKTVFLSGIASQLGAMSDSRLDPFMVAVVDPKGDLARILAPLASRVERLEKGSCVPLPRTRGTAEEIIESILVSRRSPSIRVCEGSLLRRGLVVFDLTGLPNEDRDVAAALIMASLTLEASEDYLPGRVVLVVDEAWRVNLAGARHMILALREGRSRGLYVVYATQSPRDVPEGVLANTGTLVVFGGYTRAYTDAARLLGLDDSRRLLTLPVGVAFLRLKESAPVEVRVFGFHEYVKREPPARAGEGRGVGRNGQEAEAAEGGAGLANLQEPRPHTPGPRKVPAPEPGDAEG